jgi:hypothetical protein
MIFKNKPFRSEMPRIPVSCAELDSHVAFIRGTGVPYEDLWIQELRQCTVELWVQEMREGTMDAFVAQL